MARYLGPKHKLCRRFGIKLCDSLKCPITRRPYKPGQHGPKGASRSTEYGLQLSEKQKAKFIYGVLERQFVNYYKHATAQTGDTGENLFRLLEMRLDNVLYRSGLCPTRRSARQLVSHGHVTINGRKTNIPSYQCKKGDTIRLLEKSENMLMIRDVKKRLTKHKPPSWITLRNADRIGIEVTGQPEENELAVGVDPALIVEYYSR